MSIIIVLPLSLSSSRLRAPLQLADALAQASETAQLRDRLRPFRRGLGRHHRRVRSGAPDRLGDEARRGDGNPVDDLDVSHYARRPTDGAVLADSRASRDPRESRDGGVRPDAHVVRDLDLVVELDPVL